MIGLAMPRTVLGWAPWLMAATAAAGALWYRAEYQSCRAAAAIEAARAEQTLRTQRTADAAFTRALEERLAPLSKAIEEQANATQLALAKVPSDPNCAHTPAAAAFDGSVRPAGQPSGPGAARSAGPRSD
jgi:hypothetical protein